MSMSDDEVRSPKSEVRSPKSGVRGPESDVELDRALGSLTDASPSPHLHANVMRRIAEGRTAGVRTSEVRSPKVRNRLPAGSGWQLALAGAAVILVAASMWLALRPGSPQQTATTSAPSHDVTLPGSLQPATKPGTEGMVTAPTAFGGAAQRHATTHPGPAAGRMARMSPGFTSATIADASPRVIALEEIAIDSLAAPDPLEIEPLALDAVALEPMEIAPLRIDPVAPNQVEGPRH
jgi:hypothetical protein